MSDRCSEIRRESWNYIPSGRQLSRTPPLTDVKRHLDFADSDGGREAATGDDLNRTFDLNTLETKTEPDDHAMLKGMKGYQLTASDLDFLKKMQEEKLINKLQGDLEEVRRLLKSETAATDTVLDVRDRAQAQLKKFPACAELTEWVKVVLKTTSPSADLTGLDPKGLLALVTKEDAQRVVDEKKGELARMERMAEEKRKKEAAEREQLETQITCEQLKIQGLMSELSHLKSQLAQQEEAVEIKLGNQGAPQIKVEAEKPDVSEEVQDEKSQGKRRGKGRRKAVKSAETFQSESAGSRLTGGKADDQGERANKNAKEASKTRSRAAAGKPTGPVKASRGPQKKVGGETNSQETERRPERAQTSASRPTNQSAATEEEAPDSGLRRSKRIASRK